MSELKGIKYTRDAARHKRYVRIDLDMYGENRLLEDFLDLMDIEASKGEPTYPFEDVVRELEEKHGTKLL